MELDWEARIKKWDWGIDLGIITKEDLKEYLDTKLYQYIEDRSTDHNL
jgi:hypothetical protein